MIGAGDDGSGRGWERRDCARGGDQGQGLGPGMDMKPFDEIPMLSPNEEQEVSVHVKFASVNRPAKFELLYVRHSCS